MDVSGIKELTDKQVDTVLKGKKNKTLNKYLKEKNI